MTPEPTACTAEVCITCSDAAVPVRVLALRAGDLALVRTASGTEEEVSVALVDAAVGDTVLVHAGEALATVTPESAGSATSGADPGPGP